MARFHELKLRVDGTGAPGVYCEAHQEISDSDELDGTYLIRTDRTNLAEGAVWKLYVMLSRIERSLRYLKSNLGLRPVFHR